VATVRVRRIIRHEVLSVRRDGRLRLGAVLVLVLLAATLFEGMRESAELRAEREEAQEVMRVQWLEQGEKNPHSAAHLGIYAFRPISFLGFVDPGLNPHVGEAVWLEAHYQNQPVYRPTRGREPLGSFGDLTFSRTVQQFLPLLVILLSFQLFTRERERGILPQLIAGGASNVELMVGKVLGMLIVIALLLAPFAALGTGALLLSESLGAGTFLRLGLWILVHALFLALWVMVSAAVSMWAPSGRVALLVLLSLWFAQGFIIPPAAAEVARVLHPLPSAQAFQERVVRDMAEGVDGHNPQAERTRQLQDSILGEFGVDRVEDLPVNFEGIALQAGEEFGNQVFDLRFGEIWGSIEAQNRVQLRASFLSPFLAVRSLSMGFSGTDWLHVRDFQEAAERYRRGMVETMNLALIHEFESQSYGDNIHGRETWERVPDFEYHPPPLRVVLRTNGEAVGWLGGWALVALLLTAAASMKGARP